MNESRYRRFRAYIKRLQRELKPEEFFKTLDTKLLDFAFRNPDINIIDLRVYVTHIFGPQFVSYAAEIVKKYDNIVTTVNDLYSDIGVDISRDFKNIAAIERVNSIYLGKFTEKEIDLITTRTREGLVEGLTKNELKDKISQVSDAVKVHAEVLAQTQIKGYGRGLKYEKAQIGEVFYYRYADLTLRENSHELCKREVPIAASGVSRHINVINKMNNGDGQPKPVIIYCGGWHCYHDWEPDPFYEEK